MRRIKIEIDDGEVTTSELGGEEAGLRRAVEPAAPPEVLAAAAAVGANDAGPAPAGPGAAGFPESPSPAEGAATVGGPMSDMSAGGAREDVSEPEAVTIEVDEGDAGEPEEAMPADDGGE
jgi:hypothetical protein